MTEYFQPLTFTRYLYSLIEVKQSLLIALLDHNCKEALFWGYELYFSGFEEDAFEYLLKIYQDIYSHDNPKLQAAFEKTHQEWEADNTKHHLFGSIIATLSGKPYQISHFLSTYFGIKCTEQEKPPAQKTLNVKFKEADVEPYKTQPNEIGNPRFYLPKVYQYAIRKEVNQLFKTEPVDFKKEYLYDWLYYAARSPIWLQRIVDYNGQVNDETKAVDFASDDDQDNFYDEWGIEPDEQTLPIVQKSIGNGLTAQLSIKEFCEKYGAKLVIKTMKIKKPLTNSITYT